MHIYTRVGWFRPPPMGTGLKYGPERFCWWSYRISPVGYFSTVGDHLFSVLVPFYNLSFFAQFSIGFTVLKATRGLRYRPYIRSWPFFPCPPTRPKAIRPNPLGRIPVGRSSIVPNTQYTEKHFSVFFGILGFGLMGFGIVVWMATSLLWEGIRWSEKEKWFWEIENFWEIYPYEGFKSQSVKNPASKTTYL